MKSKGGELLLSPELIAKARRLNLRNIVAKIAQKKTLTAREIKLLEASNEENSSGRFAKTWHALADKIGRSRRCIQKWREKFANAKDLPKPRADGRHDVNAWLRFMEAHDLEDEPDDETDEETKAHWDRLRARVDYERAVYNFDLEQKKHVSIDEISAAVGQMLAGFRTALNMLPGSAARWLIGLRDFHAIKTKLQSEVDGVLQALGRCQYLENVTPAVVDRLFADRTPEFRGELTKCVDGIYRELGRLALQDLLQSELPNDDAATRPETVQPQEPPTGRAQPLTAAPSPAESETQRSPESLPESKSRTSSQGKDSKSRRRPRAQTQP